MNILNTKYKIDNNNPNITWICINVKIFTLSVTGIRVSQAVYVARSLHKQQQQ